MQSVRNCRHTHGHVPDRVGVDQNTLAVEPATRERLAIRNSVVQFKVPGQLAHSWKLKIAVPCQQWAAGTNLPAQVIELAETE